MDSQKIMQNKAKESFKALVDMDSVCGHTLWLALQAQLLSQQQSQPNGLSAEDQISS